MTRQPEGRLVARIRRYLSNIGAVAYKIHGGGDPYQEVGIPDLLCCYRGRFVGIECKLPGEIPSRAQQVQLNRIARAGGIAIVAYNVRDVVNVLSELEDE